MLTKVFWIDAFERALSTAAQFALGAIGGQSIDKIDGGIEVVLLAAATGFLLTVLKALAAAGFRDRDTASFAVNPPATGTEHTNTK